MSVCEGGEDCVVRISVSDEHGGGEGFILVMAAHFYEHTKEQRATLFSIDRGLFFSANGLWTSAPGHTSKWGRIPWDRSVALPIPISIIPPAVPPTVPVTFSASTSVSARHLRGYVSVCIETVFYSVVMGSRLCAVVHDNHSYDAVPRRRILDNFEGGGAENKFECGRRQIFIVFCDSCQEN